MKKTMTLLGVVVIAGLALFLAMAAAQATAQSAIVEPTGPDQDVQVLGALSAGQLGSATAVGDVNGDGYGDLVVAAPLATLRVAGETYTESGAVYLFVNGANISHTWDLTDRVPNVTFYHEPDSYTGDWLGTDLAIGDLNADGIEDIVMGTPGFLGGHTGAGIVFLGRTSITAGTHISVNLFLTSSQSQPGYNVRLLGAYTENRLGTSVAVGDVNGDGFDDLIAGAYSASPDLTPSPYYPDRRIYHYAAPITRSQSGAVYVVLGRSIWTTDSSHYLDLQIYLYEATIYGDDSYDAFGRSVASGDLNGDGYDDIVVGADGGDPGAPLTRTNAGEIYVFWGRSTITYTACSGDFYSDTFVCDNQIITDLHYITQTAHVTLTGVMTDDGAGYDLSTADLNQDGYDDITIGAPGASPSSQASAGAAYVVYGRESFSPTVPLSSADLTLSGASADDRLGQAVAAADLNRDGYDDLLLGTPYADYSPVITDTGALYVLCGGDNLSGALDLNNSAHYNARVRITHALAYMGFGPSGGDVNTDGWPELVVGAPGYDPPDRPDAGAAYAIGPRFHLTPSSAVVQAGQPITYAADLRTLCSVLDVAPHPSTTLVAAPGAGGGWDGATFSTTLTGTWIVTATHRGLTDTALLTVTPGAVARVVVSPTAIALDPSEVFTFTARAFNVYDYPLTGITFTWSVIHGGGDIHPSQGVFTATLADGVYSETIVALADGASGTATVTVNNLAPTAVIAGAPLSGDEGQVIQFDGSPSSDPNGDPLTYTWDVAYAPPAFDVDATGQAISYTWADNGIYTVALRVRDDDDDEHITATQVTINNVPPTADANGPYTAFVGEVITLTGSATDPGGSFDPLTYTWDLDNDGDFETPGRSVPFSQSIVSENVVALRVADDDGGEDTVTTTVSVRFPSPTGFQVDVPPQGWVNLPFSVTITALDDTSHTLTCFDGYGILSTDSGHITPTLRLQSRPALAPLNGPTQIRFADGAWQGQVILSRSGLRQIIVADRDGPASGQASLFIYHRMLLPLVLRNE
jgi:hypothetical protein